MLPGSITDEYQITFLNSVVMPDETVESSDESVTDTNGSEEAS